MYTTSAAEKVFAANSMQIATASDALGSTISHQGWGNASPENSQF
jgi:hypothetical protein